MPYPIKGPYRITEMAKARHRSANIKTKAVDYSNPIYDIDPISGSFAVQWKGPWNSATAYVPGDVVSYAGIGGAVSSWVAKVGNTNVTPVEGATWTVVASGAAGAAGTNGTGFNPAEPWVTAHAYSVNDIVTYAGQTYRVAIAHTSSSAPPLLGSATYILWAAKGADGTGATVGDLDDLTDVIITSPQLDQILKYDGTYWQNVEDTSGTGTGGASTLNELDDVIISSPLNGQQLVYDSATSSWINVATQEPLQMGEFLAYMNISSPQSNFTSGVTTPLIYSVESSDEWGWYNPTNGRYTPQEPGWYVLSGSARIKPITTGGFVQLYVLKNGAEYACVGFSQTSRTDFAAVAGSGVVYANGTTDYFQLGLHQNLGINTPDIDTTSGLGNPFNANNYFSGAYVGAAGSTAGDPEIAYAYEEVELSFPGDLIAGTLSGRYQMPVDGTITEVFIVAPAPSTSGSITLDLNRAASGSLGTATTLYTTQANRPTLTSGSYGASATLPDIVDLSAGDHLLADVDGAGTNAQNVSLIVRYRYENGTVLTGGGGATDLDSLTDVTLASPTGGQVLKYNSATGQWENDTDLTSGGGLTLPYLSQSGSNCWVGAWGDGNPNPWVQMNNGSAGVTTLSGSGITTSKARCVKFRLPFDISVTQVSMFSIGGVTGVHNVAMYPDGLGSTKVWESGVFNQSANGWLNLTTNTPFSLSANTDYWFALSATSASSTAAFYGMNLQNSQYYGADDAPFASASIGIPVLGQFSVTSGVFPSTLPAIEAQANGTVFAMLKGTV